MKTIVGILASTVLAAGTAFAGDTDYEKSFDELDRDQDGVVTKTELSEDQELLAAFNLADADNDGLLTRIEFDSIREPAEEAE